jgi:Flp pilus assembly protein TadD
MFGLFCRQCVLFLLAIAISGCSVAHGKQHWWSSEDRELAVKRPSDHALYQAKLHFRNRDYGLAEKYYRYAIEENPNSTDAWLGLAASYDHLRRFDLAQRAYRVVIKQVGYAPTVLNNLAYHHMLQGDLAQARKYLDQAEAKDPGNPHVQRNYQLLNEWASSPGFKPKRL